MIYYKNKILISLIFKPIYVIEHGYLRLGKKNGNQEDYDSSNGIFLHICHMNLPLKYIFLKRLK